MVLQEVEGPFMNGRLDPLIVVSMPRRNPMSSCSTKASYPYIRIALKGTATGHILDHAKENQPVQHCPHAFQARLNAGTQKYRRSSDGYAGKDACIKCRKRRLTAPAATK